MVNPYKSGDKVLILRKGIELEATVRTTWNHEVQVRASDGELLWRTVKTVRSATPDIGGGTHLATSLPEPETAPEVELVAEVPSDQGSDDEPAASEETAQTAPDSVVADKPAYSAAQQPSKRSRGGKKRSKSPRRRKGMIEDGFDQ